MAATALGKKNEYFPSSDAPLADSPTGTLTATPPPPGSVSETTESSGQKTHEEHAADNLLKQPKSNKRQVAK